MPTGRERPGAAGAEPAEACPPSEATAAAALGLPGPQGRGRVSAPDTGRGAASPAGRGAGKLREGNSRAVKSLRRAAHGLRHLPPPLSPQERGPGNRRGARSADSADPED